MITLNDIQLKLRDAIASSKLTQKEIAEKLNVHPTAVNKYMRENTLSALDTFANLCEILEISSDEILGLKK